MTRKDLYMIAALVWGIPGTIVAAKGISAYTRMQQDRLWWLILITLAVLAGFILMFRRIVGKYSARIATLPGRTTVWQTFPLRGWVLVACMMCLGMALRFFPVLPAEFTASFYTGLGPALLCSAILFVANGTRRS